MPIYEYVCATCSNRFEKLQNSCTACGPECPSCGSAEVEKQLSAPAPGAAASAAGYSGGG